MQLDNQLAELNTYICIILYYLASYVAIEAIV